LVLGKTPTSTPPNFLSWLVANYDDAFALLICALILGPAGML
jgi:hypothetical protein